MKASSSNSMVRSPSGENRGPFSLGEKDARVSYCASGRRVRRGEPLRRSIPVQRTGAGSGNEDLHGPDPRGPQSGHGVAPGPISSTFFSSLERVAQFSQTLLDRRIVRHSLVLRYHSGHPRIYTRVDTIDIFRIGSQAERQAVERDIELLPGTVVHNTVG